MKELNINNDTIKILVENMGSKISDTPHSNMFAYIYLRAKEIKEKNKQMRLHQIKNLLTAKEAIIKMKKRTNSMEKYICQ